jgi:phosphoenolpyruvate carboxykinase (GTP)
MLPFCGYNMADYFGHWLTMPRRTDPTKLPRIYGVNWFRKGSDGKFIWPGYGENSRVLAWIVGRLEGTAGGEETPIGVVPRPSDLDLDGLDITDDEVAEALSVDPEQWTTEIGKAAEYFETFGDKLPPALADQLRALQQRLS